MIKVLSPAKKLSKDCFSEGNKFSKPVFLNQSSNLVSILKSYDPPALQSLMGISENLSELNWERFQSWTTNISPDDSRQAVYFFKGDIFKTCNLFNLVRPDNFLVTFINDLMFFL